MTRMTGPDCVVMCNLINTYIHTLRYKWLKISELGNVESYSQNALLPTHYWSLQPLSMIPPKRFDVFPPDRGMLRRCLKKNQNAPRPSEHPPVTMMRSDFSLNI